MGNCASSDSNTREDKAKAASRKFEAFRDRFETIEEVQRGLRDSGLESSDVILAIDLTKSNEWSGTESFGGVRSEHGGCKHEHEAFLVLSHYPAVRFLSCLSILQPMWRTMELCAGLSLHCTSQAMNPYKSVVTIVCRTLSGALLSVHRLASHSCSPVYVPPVHWGDH